MSMTVRLITLCSLWLIAMGQSFAETVGSPDGNNTLTLDLGTQKQTRPASPVSANYVDSMIVLAVDVSGSVDPNEYKLQKDGIVSALRDPQLQQMLTQCNSRGIAVSYVEWSGGRAGPGVSQVVPWTKLQTPSDMNGFASRISAAGKSGSGDTDIAKALTAVRSMMTASPFQSDRKIVALSSDGTQDFASPGVSAEETLRRSAQQLASAGVTLHSLAIESSAAPTSQNFSLPVTQAGGQSRLRDYYERNLRAGSGASVTSIENYSQYAEAIKRQLIQMLNACVS